MFWGGLLVLTSCFFFFGLGKKLVSILFLECLMVLALLFMGGFCSATSPPLFYVFLLSVVMVLESIFSVSLYISCSRNSSTFSSFFFSG